MILWERGDANDHWLAELTEEVSGLVHSRLPRQCSILIRQTSIMKIRSTCETGSGRSAHSDHSCKRRFILSSPVGLKKRRGIILVN